MIIKRYTHTLTVKHLYFENIVLQASVMEIAHSISNTKPLRGSDGRVNTYAQANSK